MWGVGGEMGEKVRVWGNSANGACVFLNPACGRQAQIEADYADFADSCCDFERLEANAS